MFCSRSGAGDRVAFRVKRPRPSPKSPRGKGRYRICVFCRAQLVPKTGPSATGVGFTVSLSDHVDVGMLSARVLENPREKGGLFLGSGRPRRCYLQAQGWCLALLIRQFYLQAQGWARLGWMAAGATRNLKNVIAGRPLNT